MPPRRRTISTGRYVAVASCFVLLRVLLLAIVAALITTAALKNAEVLWVVGGLLVATMIVGFYFTANVKQVICPLCRTPVFVGLGGANRAKSRRRLGFAFRLIRGEQRPKCIYCGEPFRWKG